MLAERLRRLREAAGLSRQALAEKVGISASYIQALEMGIRGNPSRAVLLKLADALQVSPATLLAPSAAPTDENETFERVQDAEDALNDSLRLIVEAASTTHMIITAIPPNTDPPTARRARETERSGEP